MDGIKNSFIFVSSYNVQSFPPNYFQTAFSFSIAHSPQQLFPTATAQPNRSLFGWWLISQKKKDISVEENYCLVCSHTKCYYACEYDTKGRIRISLFFLLKYSYVKFCFVNKVKEYYSKNELEIRYMLSVGTVIRSLLIHKILNHV